MGDVASAYRLAQGCLCHIGWDSVAIRAADILRQRGPGLVDSHVAAAAIRLQARVVTYNRRDFERTPTNRVPIPLSNS